MLAPWAGQMSVGNLSDINTRLTLLRLPFDPKQLRKHVRGEELQVGV
jgi:hypothetical protein